MAVFGIQTTNIIDEITSYQVDRYVNCNEAIWRIFPIHERYATVVHLAVHLKNGQWVYFTASNVVQRAEAPPATTLTSFFATFQSDPFTRTLLCSEMPRYYTWNDSTRKFQCRKHGDAVPGLLDVSSTDVLGRIYTVHPKNYKCFYLRFLLVNVWGPTSFESLRTVNGIVCPTFRAACPEFNLLENDNHWETTMAEATYHSISKVRYAHYLLSFFRHAFHPIHMTCGTNKRQHARRSFTSNSCKFKKIPTLR